MKRKTPHRAIGGEFALKGFDEFLQFLCDNSVAGIVEMQAVHGVGFKRFLVVGVDAEIAIEI